MSDKATSDLWWKDAIIYCADVATWRDSDGDGIGDLAGLTGRLDYLSGLGITTLWMLRARRSSLRLRRRRDTGSTAAASAGGWPRCSAMTSAGSGSLSP
jgi:Alpha amylase, catalytic domain